MHAWLHPGVDIITCMRAWQDLEKQLEQTENQLSENADRIGIMDEHLNNVQQELKYTQSRVREGTQDKLFMLMLSH